MEKYIEIYFDDLNEEAQERVLDFYGFSHKLEGNFDLIPLFVLEIEEEEE